jgi:hypothetical protein
MTPVEQYLVVNRDTSALALDKAGDRFMYAVILAGTAGVAAHNAGRNNGMALLGLAGVLVSGFVLVTNPEKSVGQ